MQHFLIQNQTKKKEADTLRVLSAAALFCERDDGPLKLSFTRLLPISYEATLTDTNHSVDTQLV